MSDPQNTPTGPVDAATTDADEARIKAMLADVDEFDDMDAAVAEIRHKPYGFTYEGHRFVLPHVRDLDIRQRKKLEDSEITTAVELDEFFQEILGPSQAVKWRTVPVNEPRQELFFKRWLAHSGAKLGEEPASNDSSGNTGQSSRPTSDASTASGSPKRSSVKKTPARRAPRKVVSPPVSSST